MKRGQGTLPKGAELILVVLYTLATISLCIPVDTTNSGRINTLAYDYARENPAASRWALVRISAPEAWQTTTGSTEIVVAVLDTGIDGSHKDLASKIMGSIDFSGSASENDVNGHGTHIAGIIAGGKPTEDSTGVAPKTSLLNVKVAGDDGSSTISNLTKGIIWAADNGAEVVNISLTFKKQNEALEQAINYAWERGCVIVAAAGNTPSGVPVYPAAYPNVIAVSAVDAGDEITRWSNRGDWVQVAAPGVDIYSTLPGGNYGYMSGTSQATALVSGEAALLFTVAKDTNGNGRLNDEISEFLKNSRDELSKAPDVKIGRINVMKAVIASKN